MKKNLLLLALAIGFATTAHAQTVRFGVKAGTSLTSFTGHTADEFKYKFGFHAGAVANFAINNRFSIQPELLYSQKGADESALLFDLGSAPPLSAKFKLKYNYLDVPVLARINAGGLFFELGPQIGFLVAAHSSLKVDGQSQSSSVDIKNGVASVDFGYAGGLGYQLPSGPGIGLRYNGGFTKVARNAGANEQARNSAFQLYLTYMLGSK